MLIFNSRSQTMGALATLMLYSKFVLKRVLLKAQSTAKLLLLMTMGIKMLASPHSIFVFLLRKLTASVKKLRKISAAYVKKALKLLVVRASVWLRVVPSGKKRHI